MAELSALLNRLTKISFAIAWADSLICVLKAPFHAVSSRRYAQIAGDAIAISVRISAASEGMVGIEFSVQSLDALD